MDLVVFDIDGTLIEKTSVEDACFMKAVRLELEDVAAGSGWGAFRNVTDAGIVHELFERHRDRPPKPAEADRIATAYARRLSERLRARPDEGREIPGASELLRTLLEGVRWRVAVATGNWRSVARFKWARAGLPAPGLPMATADDARRRAEILEVAVERARDRYGLGPSGRVLSVGDAVWDLEAARSVGAGFAAVGDGWSGAGGSGDVMRVKDFSNLEEILETFESAASA